MFMIEIAFEIPFYKISFLRGISATPILQLKHVFGLCIFAKLMDQNWWSFFFKVVKK